MGCFRFHFHGLKQILFLFLWDPVAPHHFPQSHAIHAMERLGAGINEQKYESESIQMRQIVVGTPQKKAFICLVLPLRTYCNWQYFRCSILRIIGLSNREALGSGHQLFALCVSLRPVLCWSLEVSYPTVAPTFMTCPSGCTGDWHDWHDLGHWHTYSWDWRCGYYDDEAGTATGFHISGEICSYYIAFWNPNWQISVPFLRKHSWEDCWHLCRSIESWWNSSKQPSRWQVLNP